MLVRFYFETIMDICVFVFDFLQHYFVCVGGSTMDVIDCYYTYLEGHMDADSVSHMMYRTHLITDDDYDVICSAPNDFKMNFLILQYVKQMDEDNLLKFCNALKGIERHQTLGSTLQDCKLIICHSLNKHM